MRKVILSTILALGFAVPALAISKIDTNTRRCADIQALLDRDGQAILRYPSRTGQTILRYPSRTGQTVLFDRFASNTSQCNPNEYGVPVNIPSADGACVVFSCLPLSNRAP
ncbi:hypothetical protein QBD01_001488 [Ochrobactrum sp. 19YEA23]|uniref:hypothetical protein n=1 Tax=Ochrobactrum sp. 19YEA23 TaxID=3039854 RepID=UPI00247936B3|nr:hypothetical protein [Ochrobactrum sp. 19YEA23]